MDDDHAWRVATADAVDRDDRLELVGTAADGKEALAVLEHLSADVVALDLSLPVVDGAVLLGLLRRRHVAVGVLLLTGTDDPRAVSQALQHEPDGLLPKDASPKEICDALVSIARADTTFAAKTQLAQTDSVAQIPPRLGDRELAVLTLIASGLRIHDIASRLHVSVTSVKNALSTVRAKLDASTNVEAAVKAMRAGLIE